MKRVDEIEKEAHRVSRNGDEFSSKLKNKLSFEEMEELIDDLI